ncbi:probable E3 ubiquitin-protein ligase ARI11, partial [Carica papaya]|uniref:probable E3 ubiquitin-protein ligase ARI11 n=1 Tax=Carica papaya TaxID=3649 RepID=UPI000B8D0A12
MEDQESLSHGSHVNSVRELRLEEDEEEFRSCCEDEEVWKETEELGKTEESKEDIDEFSVKMFFKGISIAEAGDAGSGYSGIGVVMERSPNIPLIQVQKKLGFYVEESVADYLALMDGLAEAIQNNINRVYAFTDSELLYDQIMHEDKLETPLLIALRQRIIEQTDSLDAFFLDLVPREDLERPLELAQVAIGVVSSPSEGDKSVESCSICCEDKPALMMIKMKCSHKFCSHCMRTYVDGKVQSSQVPIRCPQLKCKYFISTTECKSFLPLTSYESLERALAEANIFHSDKMYCPYPNCSALLDSQECLSPSASSSSMSGNSCVECPVCQRFICVECEVPWHSAMSCEEYQNLPLEERDASDITLHRLAQNKRWKRCQQCRRMIELTQGCYHMTCRCGHEFCYSCGAEYREGPQTCQCAFWDEDNSEDLVNHSVQESEQWAWETFNSLPMIMDAYSDREITAATYQSSGWSFSLSDITP